MNVVVILLDSLRADHLGCYGNPWIKTPNLDRFAAGATVFERAYSEGLPTLPFRNAAFTGRYTLPRRPWGPLPETANTLSEVLWNKGVTSAFISDTQHAHRPPHSNFARGWDYVEWIRGNEGDAFRTDSSIEVPYDFFENVKSNRARMGRPADIVKHRYVRYLRNISPWIKTWWETDENHFVAQTCKAGISWLERQRGKDNLFLWLDCFDPHEPWDPARADQELYPVPEYRGPLMCWYGGYDDVLDSAEAAHIRSLYAAKITMCDRWAGRVLDKLDELGLRENTLVIVLSDHGEFVGERNLFLKEEPWPYEELAHIPLIIRHPAGHARGRRIKAFVDSTDLMPTILEAFRVIGPAKREFAFEATKFLPQASIFEVEGESVLPLMRGEKEKIRDTVISGNYGLSWRIRDEEWVFYLWGEEKETKRARPELYRTNDKFVLPAPRDFDREKSMAEPPAGNLIDRYPQVAEHLELQLRRWLQAKGWTSPLKNIGRSAIGYFWTPPASP